MRKLTRSAGQQVKIRVGGEEVTVTVIKFRRGQQVTLGLEGDAERVEFLRGESPQPRVDANPPKE